MLLLLLWVCCVSHTRSHAARCPSCGSHSFCILHPQQQEQQRRHVHSVLVPCRCGCDGVRHHSRIASQGEKRQMPPPVPLPSVCPPTHTLTHSTGLPVINQITCWIVLAASVFSLFFFMAAAATTNIAAEYQERLAAVFLGFVCFSLPPPSSSSSSSSSSGRHCYHCFIVAGAQFRLPERVVRGCVLRLLRRDHAAVAANGNPQNPTPAAEAAARRGGIPPADYRRHSHVVVLSAVCQCGLLRHGQHRIRRLLPTPEASRSTTPPIPYPAWTEWCVCVCVWQCLSLHEGV